MAPVISDGYARTFPMMRPSGCVSWATSMCQIRLHRNGMLAHRARNFDVNRVRFTNPFIPLIRFTVGTGLEILSKHERGHLLQAERIWKNSDFPESGLS